jgi:IgA Peptidase M64/Calx-beta domain
MSRSGIRNAWMALALLGLLLGGIAQDASGEPVTVIRDNGDSANRVDLVILGDGYTAGQLGRYAADVEIFVQGLFAEEPFKEYQRYFNVHRVDVTSNESGADHPGSGIFRDTALDAAYDCFGTQRLICVDVTKVNDVLLRSVSADKREVVLVIVNDPEYGGSGGFVAVASVHPEVVELILHELGHSFGLLADEYGGPPPPFCDASVEPPEVNVTQATSRDQIKWNHWIAPSTPIPTLDAQPSVPGLYEGAKYCDTGLFRPTFDSKMRSLNRPFDTINAEQLVKRVYNWSSPIDSSRPIMSTIRLEPGQAQLFRVEVPHPLTHSLDVAWQVDGHTSGIGSSFTLRSAGLSPGPHTVEVFVSDPTPFVRNDPAGILGERRSWDVIVERAPTVAISATDNLATEAGRTRGRFTLTRTGSTALPLPVNYTVGGTAIRGKDYVALPGSRTIPAGAASATIIVTPINDRLMERNETVVLQLVAGAYGVGVPSRATVRLVSDERVTVSATDRTATEAGRTTGRFTLTRTGSTALPLTVNYTVGGTAIKGRDYVALPGSRTIPAGAASATIIVTPINDRLMEGRETVVLRLAPGPYRVGVPGGATVRLISDERVTSSPSRPL